MTIPTSSVPLAYAYLVTAIEANIATDANADSILLALTENPADQPDEIIALGDVVLDNEIATMVGSGGQGWLDEIYTIGGMVSVFTGSGPEDGETTVVLTQIARAWQLWGYVDTAVRADPSLGDLVTVAFPYDVSQPMAKWTEGDAIGLLVEITFKIRVTNRS
jgi:hypothetical protein